MHDSGRNVTQNKRWILSALKITVTSALIYWLVSGVDWNRFTSGILSVDRVCFLGAFAANMTAVLLGGVRWWLLLRHKSMVSFGGIFRSFYLGVFFNNVLPTNIGGDVVRVLHLKGQGLSLRILVGSTIVDRIIGLLIVIAMGVFGFVTSPDIPLGESDRRLLIGLLLIATAGVGLMFLPATDRILSRLLERYRQTRIRRHLIELMEICLDYKYGKLRILSALMLTVLIQSLVVFSYYVLGQSIGLDLNLTTYLAVIPLVILATALPISFGGLGVREGALVGLLLAVHADQQLAIALSILYLLIVWACALPGLFFFLFAHPADTDRIKWPLG